MSKLWRLLSLLAPYKKIVIEVLIFQLLIIVFTLPQPFLIKYLIDKGTIYSNVPVLQILIVLVFLMSLCAFLYFITNYTLLLISNIVAFRTRLTYFNHIQNLSFSTFDRLEIGDLLSRFKDLSLSLPPVIAGMVGAIGNITAVITYTVLIIFIYPGIAVVLVLALVASGIVFIPLAKRLNRSFRDRARKAGEIISKTMEYLNGIKLIQAMAAENITNKRLEKLMRDFKELDIRSGRIKLVMETFNALFISVVTVICLWLALRLVLTGDISLGTMTAMLALITYMAIPIRKLIQLAGRIQETIVHLARYDEIIQIQPEIHNPTSAIAFSSEVKGKINLSGVGFSYDQTSPVLEGINVAIEPGEMVAIVGKSGAGKTTLSNLIPRFYDIKKGKILIDDQDIRSLDLHSLRQQIAVVPQDPTIFTGTVRENLCFGCPDVDMEKVIKVAKDANIHDTIMSLPKQYETWIGYRGYRLSGGERQRLTIAQALILDRPILIMDEATSYLDVESEAQIQKTLEQLRNKKTILVIAHRLTTVRKADQILVLDNHRIVESGSHEELMAKSGMYQHLVEEFLAPMFTPEVTDAE